MNVLPTTWTDAERRAWAWPERLKPSDWIEQNLYIPDNALNPEPGLYDLDRTPYWREVIDAAIDPVIREVWVYKANQVGFTQLMLALIGYWAAQDPGAVGLLMPDEASIDEIFAEQIKPMVDATPALKRLKSGRAWDSTKHEIWLTSMPILGLYAGGDSKLEKRALRYVIGDEINIYRGTITEASPIQRLLKRITNWGHRGKAIFGSKPTTADGNITKGYESCPDKRRYLMPCPHCGKYQEWIWSQVKGFRDAPGSDKFERANWVKINKPAFYECAECKKPIDEKGRLAAIQAGRWVSGAMDNNVWRAVQKVDAGGNVKGERPQSERVGFYTPGLLSPWLTMSQLAAEFIECEGDADKTRGFRNARLALPFDEIVRSVRPSVVRDKKKLAGKPLVVPKWAVAVYATFDTQKDWFAFTIRAWGWGFKSQLIHWGQCYGFDEVYKIGLESRLEIEGGGIAMPRALLIDSGGDRTNEVYHFAKRDPRIIPTKGMSVQNKKPWHESEVQPGVRLRMIDTHHFKNALHALMHDPDPTKWLPHNEIAEQYCLEMASEQLVIEKGKWIWKHNGTARNEAWDCEVLQRAAAEMDNIGVQGETIQQVPPPAAQDTTSLHRPRKW